MDNTEIEIFKNLQTVKMVCVSQSCGSRFRGSGDLRTKVGHQCGDGGGVADMDVVDGSSSCHEGEAQLDQST